MSLGKIVQRDIDKRICAALVHYKGFNSILAEAKKNGAAKDLKDLVDVPDDLQGMMGRGSSEDHSKMREIQLNVEKLISRL